MIDGIWKLYNGILIYLNEYFLSTISVSIAGFINVILNYFFLSDYGIIIDVLSSQLTLISFSVGLLFSSFIIHFKLKALTIMHKKCLQHTQ